MKSGELFAGVGGLGMAVDEAAALREMLARPGVPSIVGRIAA